MMSISLNGIAVLSINGANYGCIINGISKNDALNLLKICWFYRQEKNIMKVKNYNKFVTIYKTGKEIIMFGNIEVEKHKFHQYKSPIWISNMDISKTVVPNRVPFGKKDFKYFIGYEEDKKVRFLSIMLSKMSPYRRYFDETDYMSLLEKWCIARKI